jgi:hypothetical protein
MFPDPEVTAIFDSVRAGNETFVWTGRPAFLPYVMSGVPFLLFGMLWGAFDYFGFIRNMSAKDAGFAIPFFAIHLAPCYGSVLYMLYLVFSHKNVAYGATDKRVIIRSGLFGIDYKSIDYKGVLGMDVSVGPIENMLGAGSIRIDAGRRGSKGSVQYENITGISEPYDVFKQLQAFAGKGDANAASTT